MLLCNTIQLVKFSPARSKRYEVEIWVKKQGLKWQNELQPWGNLGQNEKEGTLKKESECQENNATIKNQLKNKTDYVYRKIMKKG